MNHKEVKKQWSIRDEYALDSIVDALKQEYNITRATAELIFSRSDGSLNGARAFINKDSAELRDPFLLADMDKAVDRILKSIRNKDDVIAIYGDYDVDGVTSVSMMYLYLTSLGLRVGYYIPNRCDEGYGVNKAAIKKLHSKGVTLIVTVDTGITAIEEIEYAKTLGIDVIITDHHECREELPDAVAVIDPHRSDCTYPFKDLAGVGVAFKLICGIEIARCTQTGKSEYQAQRETLMQYGDLVAIGTVADVMPIVDENRTIVSIGLKIIEVRPRPGIAALIEASMNKNTYGNAKKEITSTFVGFTLAPRLNAAGRMSNAAISVELLLAEDNDSALIIAQELCEINRMRQAEENRIVESALEKIEDEWDIHLKNNGVIVLADNEWQQGVIGIVASRITEKYCMPTILITFEGSIPHLSDESPVDLGKGSGRSVKGFNLVSALSECSDLLEKYGGHELAAGLSLRRTNLNLFRQKLNEYARPILDDLECVQVLEADKILDADEVTLKFATEVTQLIEPCGPQNPNPSFVMTDLCVVAVRGIGAGKHLKFIFEKNGKKFTGLLFGVSESQNGYKCGDLIDVMFTVGVNHFNGNTELQLIISDLRYAESVYNERVYKREKLFSILNGDSFSAEERIMPERSDFVALFRLLTAMVKDGRVSISDTTAEKLFSEKMPPETVPNFIKYRLMLEVFKELDIFNVDYIPLVSDKNGDRWNLPEDICVITKGKAVKVNLEDSSVLIKLRSQIRD